MGKVDNRPEVLVVDPAGDFRPSVKRAAQTLLSGGLVAYPTESFYGLAVDATNERAIKRLFSVKRRKGTSPVLVIIHSGEIPAGWVNRIPPAALELISAFWPGGLTLVFEAGPSASPLLTAGTGKIGIRCSGHPIARALARMAGVPITGTSANISGKLSCRTAEEVCEVFSRGVDLVLDGGKTPGYKGSTILDLAAEPPEILREGIVSAGELKKHGIG